MNVHFKNILLTNVLLLWHENIDSGFGEPPVNLNIFKFDTI